MARPAKEKRASQRIYYCMPAKYKIAGRKAFRKAIACGNISGGGLLLLLPEQIEVNSKIEVLFYPEGMTKPFGVLCRVAWSKRRRDGNMEPARAKARGAKGGILKRPQPIRALQGRGFRPRSINTGLEFIKVKKYDQFIDFLCDKMLDFSLGAKSRRKTP